VECIDDIGVELASAAVEHDQQRFGAREARAVDALPAEAVEDVCDCGDPCLERDLLALEPARTPAAVPALVVCPRDARAGLQHFRPRAGQDPVPG